MKSWNCYEFIAELKKIPGARSFDGDASIQVLLSVRNKTGQSLRVGITDDDVAEVPGIWWDFYGSFLEESEETVNDNAGTGTF